MITLLKSLFAGSWRPLMLIYNVTPDEFSNTFNRDPANSCYWKATKRRKLGQLGPIPEIIFFCLLYFPILVTYWVFQFLRFVLFVGWLNKDSKLGQKLQRNKCILTAKYLAVYTPDDEM